MNKRDTFRFWWSGAVVVASLCVEFYSVSLAQSHGALENQDTWRSIFEHVLVEKKHDFEAECADQKAKGLHCLKIEFLNAVSQNCEMKEHNQAGAKSVCLGLQKALQSAGCSELANQGGKENPAEMRACQCAVKQLHTLSLPGKQDLSSGFDEACLHFTHRPNCSAPENLTLSKRRATALRNFAQNLHQQLTHEEEEKETAKRKRQGDADSFELAENSDEDHESVPGHAGHGSHAAHGSHGGHAGHDSHGGHAGHDSHGGHAGHGSHGGHHSAHSEHSKGLHGKNSHENKSAAEHGERSHSKGAGSSAESQGHSGSKNSGYSAEHSSGHSSGHSSSGSAGGSLNSRRHESESASIFGPPDGKTVRGSHFGDERNIDSQSAAHLSPSEAVANLDGQAVHSEGAQSEGVHKGSAASKPHPREGGQSGSHEGGHDASHSSGHGAEQGSGESAGSSHSSSAEQEGAATHSDTHSIEAVHEGEGHESTPDGSSLRKAAQVEPMTSQTLFVENQPYTLMLNNKSPIQCESVAWGPHHDVLECKFHGVSRQLSPEEVASLKRGW